MEGGGFSPVRNTRGPRSSGWLMLRKYILKVAVLLCLSWTIRAKTEGCNGKCMFLVCWIWWRRRLKYGQIGWFILKLYINDLKQFNLSKLSFSIVIWNINFKKDWKMSKFKYLHKKKIDLSKILCMYLNFVIGFRLAKISNGLKPGTNFEDFVP